MILSTINKHKHAFLLGCTAVVLAACGGGSGGPSTGDLGAPTAPPASTTGTGVFLDAEVNGVSYSCTPSGMSGVTGDSGVAGQFTCENNDTVAFSIGDLNLGSASFSGNGDIITPSDLAGAGTDPNNQEAIRIAQILQSFDSDNNTANGITISEATVAAITGAAATALQTALDSGTDFTNQLNTAGALLGAEFTFVNAVTAQAELAQAVAQANPGSGGGGSAITPAATANCPVGVAATERVAIFGKQFPVCVISQRITSNVTLTNNHIYVLQDTIHVGDGDAANGPTGNNNAILTINPGVQIFGYAGLTTSLVATRGSQVRALGTADQPIIMASVTATGAGEGLVIQDDPTDLTGRGQWGGLVLSGSGVNNKCTGMVTEIETEAVPTGVQRFFGCDNNADTSGTIKYVIIAESGELFRPDQEVQGLTIEAAGSGTTIDFLQILGSEDDGIEWFGGAASASNIVINGQDDDGLDFDEGAQFTLQKVLVIMGNSNGDKGIEADNAGPSNDATPVSNVNFVNMTIIGDQGKGGSKGANFRLGFGGRVFRSAIVDSSATVQFVEGCFDFDDQVDAFTEIRDVAVNCANGVGTGGVIEDAGNALTAAFFNNGDNETGAGDAPIAERDITDASGIFPNGTTLAVDPGSAPDNAGTLPAAVNNTAIGNYFGAVDPASGAPDFNPNNNGGGGGPFWDGWTYINSGVDGGLPGPNFHPLQAEIQ